MIMQKPLEQYELGDAQLSIYAGGDIFISSGIAGLFLKAEEFDDVFELLNEWNKERKPHGRFKFFKR